MDDGRGSSDTVEGMVRESRPRLSTDRLPFRLTFVPDSKRKGIENHGLRRYGRWVSRGVRAGAKPQRNLACQ